MSERAPEAIGSNLQLFMDDHWIATSDGARRLMHPAVKRNAAILPENPWEMGYVGVVYDYAALGSVDMMVRPV